jgi:hypothetical protein
VLHIATLYITRGGEHERSRRTCLADWVRMAREFVFERGDYVRERLAFGILILLLICLFAFTFAVLGKGEYEPTGEKPQQVYQSLA